MSQAHGKPNKSNQPHHKRSGQQVGAPRSKKKLAMEAAAAHRAHVHRVKKRERAFEERQDREESARDFVLKASLGQEGIVRTDSSEELDAALGRLGKVLLGKKGNGSLEGWARAHGLGKGNLSQIMNTGTLLVMGYDSVSILAGRTMAERLEIVQGLLKSLGVQLTNAVEPQRRRESHSLESSRVAEPVHSGLRSSSFGTSSRSDGFDAGLRGETRRPGASDGAYISFEARQKIDGVLSYVGSVLSSLDYLARKLSIPVETVALEFGINAPRLSIMRNIEVMRLGVGVDYSVAKERIRELGIPGNGITEQLERLTRFSRELNDEMMWIDDLREIPTNVRNTLIWPVQRAERGAGQREAEISSTDKRHIVEIGTSCHLIENSLVNIGILNDGQVMDSENANLTPERVRLIVEINRMTDPDRVGTPDYPAVLRLIDQLTLPGRDLGAKSDAFESYADELDWQASCSWNPHSERAPAELRDRFLWGQGRS